LSYARVVRRPIAGELCPWRKKLNQPIRRRI